MHFMGSLLPKCFFSFVTMSKENMSFFVLHNRFMVKLCLSQIQAQCRFKSS